MSLVRFKNFEPAGMYSLVAQHVFPFLRTLGRRQFIVCPLKETEVAALKSIAFGECGPLVGCKRKQ